MQAANMDKREKRNEYRILVGIVLQNEHLEDRERDGRIP
jgi:hypothetical protein